MTEQADSSRKTSPIGALKVHPELVGTVVRRTLPLLALAAVLLCFGVPYIAQSLSEDHPQILNLVLIAVVLFLVVRQLTATWLQLARISRLLESGATEQVELILEQKGRGLIARVRSALDFSVPHTNDWEIYFASQSSKRLFAETDFGKSLILPAIYGFDPNDPLLVRTPKGLLWLDSKDADRIDESATLLLRAYSCYGKDKNEEAIALLNQAIAVNPKYIDAVELRGYCWQRLGLIEKSIEDFTTVLDERARSLPGVHDMSATFISRATAFMDIEEYEKALTDLSTAIELTPDQMDLYLLRSTVNEYLGRNAAAVIDATKCLDLSNGTATAEEVAEILIRRGMNHENEALALKDIDEAIATFPSPSAFYFRACVHLRHDRYQEVIEQCTRALELNSAFEPALKLRAEAHLNSGNPAAAHRDLTRLEDLQQQEPKETAEE